MSEKPALVEATPITKARRKKQVEARYIDYVEFFQEELGKVRRDLLSDDSMYWSARRKRWMPVFNEHIIGHLQGRAIDSNERFKPHHIKPHLHSLHTQTEPELLFDVPEWDGIDRIEKIAECFTMKEDAGLSIADAYELLKDWGARMWDRIEDPTIQNRILIIIGSQGAGKDTLIRSMVGGLGQFFLPLTISENEKDLYQQIIGCVVAHVSEFDRANRADAATLKHVITADRLNFRKPYGVTNEDWDMRCSFIASCNVESILKDETGARRFIIFNLDKIDWNYPTDKSMQILAQWKHLSKVKFHASPETEAALANYLNDSSPINTEEEIINDFGFFLWEKLKTDPKGTARLFRADELDLFWERSKNYNKRPNDVKAIVKKAKFGKHFEQGNRYFLNFEWAKSNIDEFKENALDTVS